MKLTDEVKKAIEEEYNEWVNVQYGNNNKKTRDELGQFYTPPEITIKMIEMIDWDTLKGHTILDPTCGAGGLLAACIIAGADPELCFGNEFDINIVELCRRRLGKLGVPKYNIHQGDALDKRCLDPDSFTENYKYPFAEVKKTSLW